MSWFTPCSCLAWILDHEWVSCSQFLFPAVWRSYRGDPATDQQSWTIYNNI